MDRGPHPPLHAPRRRRLRGRRDDRGRVAAARLRGERPLRDPGFEVRLVAADRLPEGLGLLEEALREGEPVPAPFAEELRGAVARGDLEMLVAREEGAVVGVALLSYGLNVSAGGAFASVEELHVRPEARRRGAGRALLAAVEERCAARGVSYVEVQTDDEAVAFYEASGYEREEGVLLLSLGLPLHAPEAPDADGPYP
ncbi:GNAT family N-acetyltransferase [Rubrobacter marinus]|uniref:GNAT family N-acetyltransferase n=1 Tax=Rubrobacter marinus TaxID=2653852 RepID=A0A6G8PZ63_9ACTN|nr:GNAT family N-acetyltransferase [Rubrobacter marinus]QIN79503.1 GNAT family N-acetyltransferase [Rubrobacter marinus]